MNALLQTANGKTVSSLGLGTWAWGSEKQWGKTSFPLIKNTFFAALEMGINVVDTAPAYGWGLSEEIVGQLLKNQRKNIVLATKCGLCLNADGRPDHDLRPFHIIEECESSLKRLCTDYLDTYYIHWPDWKVPLAEVLGALETLKKQGKIRALGICNFPLPLLQEACGITRIDSVEYRLSLLGEDYPEVRAFCQKNNIHFWGYGVLGGGILSGKYVKEPNFPRSDARRYFYKHYVAEQFLSANGMAQRVKAWAEQRGLNPSAVALAWALTQAGVGGVLVGARTPEQIQQNAQALQIYLSTEEQEFLKYGAVK